MHGYLRVGKRHKEYKKIENYAILVFKDYKAIGSDKVADGVPEVQEVGVIQPGSNVLKITGGEFRNKHLTGSAVTFPDIL